MRFPKEAFDLKEEFRKLYWSKRDKEEYKDSLPAMEERNALKETVRENLHVWFDHVKKSKSPGMKTFMRTIKEREEDLLRSALPLCLQRTITRPLSPTHRLSR